MYFELMISKVDNGFIASFWEEGEDGAESVKTQIVFEDDNSEYGHLECFQRLLYYITEHYAMTGTKHDARRIRIMTGAKDES